MGLIDTYTNSVKLMLELPKNFNVSEIDYATRSKFYDIEYPTKIDHEFYISFFNNSVKNVLEIPCGSGRNIDMYSKVQASVILADKELEMVNIVKRKLKKRTIQNNMEALLSDITNISLKNSFDLIIVPQGGIQLLSRKSVLLKSLKSLKSHLTDAGILIIDVGNINSLVEYDLAIRPTYYTPEINDGVAIIDWERKFHKKITITRIRIQSNSIRFLNTYLYYYFCSEASKKRKLLLCRMRTRKYRLEEFKEMLFKAGLKLIDVYRNYNKEPFDMLNEKKSTRMIFIISK